MNEKTQQMSTQLTERAETLRNELIELEKQFNTKKEEYLKVQGALEALEIISQG